MALRGMKVLGSLQFQEDLVLVVGSWKEGFVVGWCHSLEDPGWFSGAYFSNQEAAVDKFTRVVFERVWRL